MLRFIASPASIRLGRKRSPDSNKSPTFVMAADATWMASMASMPPSMTAWAADAASSGSVSRMLS